MHLLLDTKIMVLRRCPSCNPSPTLTRQLTLGQLLVAARSAAGVSQRELARRSGLSPAQVSRLEADEVGKALSQQRL